MAEGEISDEDREFIRKRLKTHQKIEKAAQVVEVLNALCALSQNPVEEAKTILTGQSPAKTGFVVEVVKSYRQGKQEMPITEFFKQKYVEKARVLVKPADAIQEAIRTPASKDAKP
ncbi:MAG: hypothetical protein PHG85_01950 [Candidatus Altiarchaeota archaeon]|nr:hypothetical protein [Candidatus Altiarchaeota archaeon]